MPSAADSGDVLLRPGKRKLILGLLGSLAFVAIGVAVIATGGGFSGWLATIFFGLGAAVFAIQLRPGSSYLRLTGEGFVVSVLYRRWPLIGWDTVTEFHVVVLSRRVFGVVRFTRMKLVAFDQEGGPQSRMGRMSRALIGAGESLPDTYGMKAEELAVLMNSWRSRARAGARA